MDAMQLGREMMSRSGDLKDDKQCCEWARIGQLLTQLGTPRMPKTFRDMRREDRQVVLDAIKALQNR
jgi:hypothetical protein